MKENKFLLKRENYILFTIGLVFIVVCFILTSGGGSENSEIYNSELFNSRRIIWAPLLVVIGFVVEIFAILRRPKS